MIERILAKIGIEFCPICGDRLRESKYKDEQWTECCKVDHRFERYEDSMDYYQFHHNGHSYVFITDGQYDPVFIRVRIDERENLCSSHSSGCFTFEELEFDPKNPIKAIEKAELLEMFG
jgi:hypothetical protein